MSKSIKKSVLFLVALLVLFCLTLTACRERTGGDTGDTESTAVTEQSDDLQSDEAETHDSEQSAKQELSGEAAEKADKDGQAEAEKAAETEAAESGVKEGPAAQAEDSGNNDSGDSESVSSDSQTKKSSASKKKSSSKAKKKSSKTKSSNKNSSGKKSGSKDKSSSDKSKSGSSDSNNKTQKKEKVWVPPVTETRTVTLSTGTRYCNGANSNGGCGASWHGTKDGTYSEWKAHWQDYVKRRTEEEAEKGNTYVCDHVHDDSRWVPDTATEEVVVKEGYWKDAD